jgi:hypothetical protein
VEEGRDETCHWTQILNDAQKMEWIPLC